MPALTQEQRRTRLNNKQLYKILTAHYISTMQIDGRIYALEEYTQDGRPGADWIDVTGWTAQAIRDWLGY
jgi:hypothetical protein